MNQKGKQLAIWGLVLQLGSVFGLVCTIIAMVRYFSGLADSGTAQASGLAQEISKVLGPAAAGSVFGLIGIILIFVALFRIRYRAPWFRTMLWVLSILWLMSFPLGTILGIIVIIYLARHKDEFTEQTPAGDALKAVPEA
jgi:hypothetical protein